MWRRSWLLMRHNARTLGGGWARMWSDGVGEAIDRRRAWIARERPALSRAAARERPAGH